MVINNKLGRFKALILLSGFFGSIFAATEKPAPTSPAAIVNKIKEKDKELAKVKADQRAGRSNWGVANLEKVRNMTTSYTDMFFEEDADDLGSRLPNNTVIQISTLRDDIQESSEGDDAPQSADKIFAGVESTLAWRQLEGDAKANIKKMLDWIGNSALSTIESSGALRDKVESFTRKKEFEQKFKGSFSGKIEDFAKVLNSQVVSLFKALSKQKPEQSPYRFYAARKLMGSWRLVADTTDPSDPATKFIVEHHRDSALNDWLGIRAQAQDNFYMSAQANNSVTLSSPKFARDDAKDAHWKLDGTSLADCGLINRKVGGFLSCRDLSDERRLTKFGFDPRSNEELVYNDYDVVGRRVKTYSPGFHLYEKHPDRREFKLSRQTQLDEGMLGRIRKLSEFFYVLKGFHVKRYLETAAAKDDTAKKDEKRNFTIRDPEKEPYKLHELMLLMAKCYRFAKDNSDNRDLKASAEAAARAISTEAHEALKRYYTKGKADKRELSYGDKIKLVSTKTWRHLYGKYGRHSAFKSAGNFNQGVPVCSTDYDDGDEALGLKEVESWWIIKGPHKKGDSFNAQMGQPVKNGDVIRLENVNSHKNLHCTKSDMGTLGTKFRKNSMVTLYGQDGDGDSFDNWVISFTDAKEPNLYMGQPFELKSQNTGIRLATDFDKRYFLRGTSGAKVEFASAIESKNDETVWAIDSYKKGSLPVENVGWTGVPYGAQSTERGPKEGLKVDIIKLGVGGGIAPNNTLEVKVNVQDKRPMVSGFAKEEIPNFAPGFMVNLSPLFSRGVAWVSQSFEHEGKASASFLVRGPDSGNAEIMLGNNMTLDYTYKFVLGASDNTETQLVRRDIDSGGRPHDTVVAKISKQENPLAALRSGAFAPYWISVHEGTVMLGVGDDIGDNVLLIWRDPNPRTQVSRLGFGSDREPVDYTNVQIGDALGISAPEIKYAVARNEVKVGDGQIMVHDFDEFEKQEVDGDEKYPDGVKFRVPGRGSLAFDVKGSDEFSVAISSKGTSEDSDGQVRYVLRLYGENVSDDFERRTGVMVEYLSQLVQLMSEKLSGTDSADVAIGQVRKAIGPTFTKLPKQSRDHINNVLKDLSRDFDSWSTFKAGFEEVKSELTSLKMFVSAGQGADLAKLNSIAGVEGDKGGGDPLKNLAKGLFKALRSNLGVKPMEKRDDIGSSGPKTAKEAVVVMLEQIFSNPHFDIEGRPVCVLEKFNSGKGKLEKVGSVLETDITSHSAFAKIPRDSYRKYWVNFSQGRIFVGSEDFGKNLFFYNWDKGPQDDFVQIALTSKGDATVRDFTVGPELAITRAQKMAAYKEDKQLFDFKGKLQVISPYQYRLSQEGPSVKFKDELTGKTYYPGKVPQRGASYYFMLVLREDGFPQLVWSREPENPGKLAIEKKAYIKKAESDTLFQASTYVQGMGVIGGLIGVGASVTYSGLGVAAGKEAASLESKAMFDYKGHDSYVYTDQAKMDKLVSSSIPQAAQVNQGNFQRELGIGGNWIGDPSKMGLLIPHFRKIISRVTHPFVVSNQSDKNLLFSHLSSLFNTHKKTYSNPKMPVDNTYADLIKLLMAAYNNRYLINDNDKRERKIKNDWYAKSNELARQVLKKDPEHTVKLEPMYGEYIWLNDTFKTPGEGSITFEAVGQNDAMICFASEPEQVRGTTKQIYECSIGSWDNEKTVLRTKSLGKTVAETTHPDMRCKIVKAESDPAETKYWLSVNKGKIVMGKGDLDPKNAIGTVDIDTGEISKVVWQDPEFKASDTVKAVAEIETELIKLSEAQQVLVSLATALSKDPFDTKGYLILLEKIKPNLEGSDFADSMKVAKAPPAKPDEYQVHLGKLLAQVDADLKKVFQAKYKGMLEGLKKLINLKKHKSLKKVITSLPEETEKYSEHLGPLMATLQKMLPEFLDDTPAYEYKEEGSYSAEPFHWQDPYPIRDVKYVGISCWDAPIEFSKITVGPRVEEVALFKSNLIAKIRAMRGEKLSQIIDLSKKTPMGKKREETKPPADLKKPKAS